MEMWFSEFHTPDVKHSIRVNRQLYSKQSDYQRIDIFETPEFGRVLTLDGNVMLTERDEFIYDEMITHVPMAIHKEARDILVIGAGDGGVVRELTRYDRVRHIDLSENVCGFLQAHLPVVLFPVHGLRWKDTQEYCQCHQILSEYHIRPAEYHKLRFLQVRYPAYVHLIS